MTAAPAAPARSVDALVEATPPHRDRYVDLLRAGSIVVVVLWHWVFSVTHWTGDGRLSMPNPVGDVPGAWLATWVLQVMPLFFVVGGFADLAGWEATRRRGGTAVDFARSRLVRLIRPIVPFAAVWLAVEAGLQVVAGGGTPWVLTAGRVVLVPLWFLAAYGAVTVIAPLTASLHQRRPGRTLLGMAAAVGTLEVLRVTGGVDGLALPCSAAVFLLVHQLGYWWRDGSLLGRGRRGAVQLAASGLAVLVGLTATGLYPASMVAVRGASVSNMFPTTPVIAALAVFQLGLALALRPVVDRWLERRRPWRAVVAVNTVAMTVFCWHMTALVVAIGVWEAAGGVLAAEPTAGWWLLRPVWVVLPGLALAPLVALFAPVEHGAAGRRGRYGRLP